MSICIFCRETNGLKLNMVAGFALIIFVPLLFMPERPPTPPSNISQNDRPPFIEGIKILCKNINFWILFFIHSFNVGLSIAFCTLCTQILTPHGYTTKEAGALNAFAFFAGTIGCCKKDSGDIYPRLTLSFFFCSRCWACLGYDKAV